MSHHFPGPVCPLCVEKLEQAHPDIKKWFINNVKPNWPLCHISWSFRNQADQEEAVAQGKSKDHWPKSPHNNMEDNEPCSLALDLFQLDQGVASFPYKMYSDINQMNTANKLPIKWGGLFKSLGDFDHFQVIFPF